MSKKLFLLPIALLFSACSTQSDYTPPAGADGKQMFIGACQTCHSSKFDLDKEMMSAEAIAKQIGTGSMAMPSFPNIKGDALVTLSTYVLEHKTAKH